VWPTERQSKANCSSEIQYWLCFAGSRLQSRISAHAIRGIDAEATPFCFRHVSTSDLAEDSCDGNFKTGKITGTLNSHLNSL
jgi:hypothetical protein